MLYHPDLIKTLIAKHLDGDEVRDAADEANITLDRLKELVDKKARTISAITQAEQTWFEQADEQYKSLALTTGRLMLVSVVVTACLLLLGLCLAAFFA